MFSLTKQSLKFKLISISVIPVVALAVVSFLALSGINSLGQLLRLSAEVSVPNINNLGEMNTKRSCIGYFIWAAYGNKEDHKTRAEFVEKAENALSEFKKHQVEYEKIEFLPGEKEIYEKVSVNLPAYYAQSEEIFTNLKQNTLDSDAKVFALINNGPWHKTGITIRKMLEANLDLHESTAKQTNESQVKLRSSLQTELVSISVGSAVLLLAIMIFIAVKVSSSIMSISKNLNTSAEEVNSAIQQLSVAGVSLSENSSASAASLEETVASMEELSAMIKLNSENATTATSLTEEAKIQAAAGEKSSSKLSESMNDISKSSKKIADIIKVIDDIAFQTNLLALNAAVEAARAGEQGKGFAVVADAVRKLAQDSANSAKQITDLIKESVEKIDQGVKVASDSGTILGQIVKSVNKVSSLNTEISAASSEELASTSEELSAQVKSMQTMITELNGLVTGKAA